MEIKTIKNRQLTNALPLQFIIAVVVLIAKFNTVAAKLGALIDAFRRQVDRENLCSKIICKSRLSDLKTEKDYEHDNLLSGIQNALKSLLCHFDLHIWADKPSPLHSYASRLFHFPIFNCRLIKSKLILIALVCIYFVPVGWAQTGNNKLRDMEGVWIFESAELHERKLNSTGNYTKRTIVSTEEFSSSTHFFPTPLQIQIESTNETFAFVSLTNPLSINNRMPCEWIAEGRGFRLNLLKEPQSNTQQTSSVVELESVPEQPQHARQSTSAFPFGHNKRQERTAQQQASIKRSEVQEQPASQEIPKNMEITASYYEVTLSSKNVLSMKYKYVYHASGDNYIEGIFTVYMKKQKN
jgi:hypothetical protein